MKKTLVLTIAISTAATLFAGEAQGGLILTIDIFTPNEFKFTLGGTFDDDVVGDQKTWLAVKNDWSNNQGVNTDWLDDSLGFQDIATAPWTVIENSILIGGFTPDLDYVCADGETWGDSIYFRHALGDILAGTTVSGSVHVQGVGLFDSSFNHLQLLSGFDDAVGEWVRLEDCVPTPGTLALLGIAFVGTRRRRRN